MAKATYIKPKPVRPPRGKVVLELTEGEADLILCVMSGFIGGDPENSPRKYADRIAYALESALDLDYKATDAYSLNKPPIVGHGVYFNDYPVNSHGKVHGSL